MKTKRNLNYLWYSFFFFLLQFIIFVVATNTSGSWLSSKSLVQHLTKSKRLTREIMKSLGSIKLAPICIIKYNRKQSITINDKDTQSYHQ